MSETKPDAGEIDKLNRFLLWIFVRGGNIPAEDKKSADWLARHLTESGLLTEDLRVPIEFDEAMKRQC